MKKKYNNRGGNGCDFSSIITLFHLEEVALNRYVFEISALEYVMKATIYPF